MTTARLARSARLFIVPALALSLAALTPAILSAQMGGMGGGMGGGGMGGGRGGGRGGPGGRGMGGGSMKSPAAMARERLEKADPIEFLLDRKKPLELTKEQQESLKSLRKEMQRTQAPVFTVLDKLFGDTSPRGGPPDGGMPGGGRRSVPCRTPFGRSSRSSLIFRTASATGLASSSPPRSAPAPIHCSR